ncbi:ribonuclease HI [Candidatus Wolfebacteria bacterium]|nr:MAG: ribonuclease HI [Candidatus Wolfebacteria bacterium]
MNKTAIFTDGASKGNPGPGGWGAVVLHDGKVLEIGEREESTTNNRMELTGVIEGLLAVKDMGASESIVYTDSQYVINGITKWVFGWQQNGWVTKAKAEVLNRDLWQRLVDVTETITVDWQSVQGHVGVPGNERADVIASDYGLDKGVELFSGTLSEYDVDLSDLGEKKELSAAKKKAKERSKAKAFSYISMVAGVVQIHQTWGETEARVKGKKGVKYKKSLSKSDEEEIVSEWKSL